MDDRAKYPSILMADLLGHQLNDVESKFAPKNGVFYRGVSEMTPLPCPRVSIIGSRGASEHGLSEARQITRLLVEKYEFTPSPTW